MTPTKWAKNDKEIQRVFRCSFSPKALAAMSSRFVDLRRPVRQGMVERLGRDSVIAINRRCLRIWLSLMCVCVLGKGAVALPFC